MKILKYISSIALGFALVFFAQSCRDTKASPLPTFETAVTTFADYKAAADSFAISDISKVTPFTYRWVSVDGQNTATKIEFFVTLYEEYKDKEGNKRTAVHGTKSFKILEGSSVPANRVYTDVTLSGTAIFDFFKTATFNYGKGDGDKPVFSQNGRTATKQFTTNDYADVTWFVTTADGRKFTEWSVAVCNEVVGSNCKLRFKFK